MTVFLIGCGNTGTSSYSPAGPETKAALIHPSIDVTPATDFECASGGKVYSIFDDVNLNGSRDPSESVLSRQVVCGGANGLTTLFAINRVTTSLTACPSGSGLQLGYGVDTNTNQVLDPSEIAQTQVLCDGANGASGAAGAAGSDGASTVLKVIPAASSACPAGGSTILMALDVQHLGQYSTSAPNQESLTICNGQNAAVSAYTPVEPIQPCGNTVAYKEVLLRLSGGEVLASFSENANGLNTRFSFLPDGSYVDTDASGCNFSLATSADGSQRAMSWLGQVQKTWAVTH